LGEIEVGKENDFAVSFDVGNNTKDIGASSGGIGMEVVVTFS